MLYFPQITKKKCIYYYDENRKENIVILTYILNHASVAGYVDIVYYTYLIYFNLINRIKYTVQYISDKL